VCSVAHSGRWARLETGEGAQERAGPANAQPHRLCKFPHTKAIAVAVHGALVTRIKSSRPTKSVWHSARARKRGGRWSRGLPCRRRAEEGEARTSSAPGGR